MDKPRKNIWKHVNVALLVLAVFAVPAYAYLDPGMGSYIFQILIASVLGLLYSIKLFWKSIKSYISKIIIKVKKKSDE
ncbi:MAG: hypothetical protein NT145_08415 [Elusimicrobia bacterium]|nr:hypothetical protein [Elusimicrobiota bacterium]